MNSTATSTTVDGAAARAYWQADEKSKRLLDEARSRTLWQTLSDAAALDPARIALVAADDEGNIQRLTYSDLLRRVRDFSAGLASIGVARGDRIVLWMTNRLEWIISCFAAARIGATTVPVNTFLRAPEVEYCISQSGARHVIILDRFRKLDMPEMLCEMCREFAEATTPGGLCSRRLPDLRNVIMYSRTGTKHPGTFDWDILESIGAANADGWRDVADEMAAKVTPEDLHMVKYTSGSTGFPKGVMLQQGGFIAVGLLHGKRTGMSRDDIYFSMMPFFHAGGSMYGQMSMLPIGGRLVFTEAFNIDLAIQLITDEQATIFVSVLGKEVVEEAFARGLTFPSVWLGQRHNEIAKAVLPNARFAFMPFGLTETYGPCAITGPNDPEDKLFTTGGRPLPGNEVRVVDPSTGEDVAPGEVGEAWIRGNLMLGYWNKPAETARAIDADGWFHSEDLVTVDEDGFVRFVGRLKLMAKVGGENVSLEEIERVVTGHDAILHCAAVSVSDPRKVEAVRVYAIMRADMQICATVLTEWLKPRLAHFKMPREILFVDELPRLGNGKLDRVTLSQWAAEEIAA